VTRSTLLAAAGLIAIGVAIGAFLRRDGAEPAQPEPLPQTRAPTRVVPAPRRAGSAEPAPQADPRTGSAGARLPVATPRVPASLADAAEEPPSLASDTDPAAPHDSGEEFATSYLRLYAKFKDEPRDPTASVAMESELLSTIAQQPRLALTSLEVECRTSICRVRLVGPDVLNESLSIPFGGFQSVVGSTDRGSDGSLVAELLLARDAVAAE
jgi:hypothetical protein